MGPRILLVEDHLDTANAFARMLRRDQYDVSVAGSAAEATTLCQQADFDLLICDITLPDGNGSEILKTARLRHPKTAGIIVSGHDEQAQLQRARDAGFSKTFLKPIDYMTLRDVLRDLFPVHRA